LHRNFSNSYTVAAMGVDPAMIYRIPHGLLGDRGHLIMSPTRRPRRDRLVFLQFGKIKPYKGIDLLLEALTLVPRALRNRLDVRIVGKPYMDTSGIERYVHANDLAACVTLRFEFVSEAEDVDPPSQDPDPANTPEKEEKPPKHNEWEKDSRRDRPGDLDLDHDYAYEV